MKTFVKIFLLFVVMLVLISAVFAAPVATFKDKDKDTVSVTMTPTPYRDLLMLKTNKAYMGALVEIHDSTGEVVASSHINKKKTIIDFYDIPSGTYWICVVQRNKTHQFNYTKKQDSEEIPN